MQKSEPIAAGRPARYRVDLEPPRMLSVKEELAVHRAAVARRPSSSDLRYRLAHNLYTLDQFDEAIEILRALDGKAAEFRVAHMLVTALLARETHQDTIEATRLASRSIELASDRSEKARALASLGKAQIRLEQFDHGRKSLNQALEANIHNKDAYKRLAMLDFNLDRTEQALEFAEEMVARDVTHARVLGIRPLALAKLNRTEEAR